ncbi:hypothetical protein ACTXT7_010458 [Hymenolepis weldensis]
MMGPLHSCYRLPSLPPPPTPLGTRVCLISSFTQAVTHRQQTPHPSIHFPLPLSLKYGEPGRRENDTRHGFDAHQCALSEWNGQPHWLSEFEFLTRESTASCSSVSVSKSQHLCPVSELNSYSQHP